MESQGRSQDFSLGGANLEKGPCLGYPLKLKTPRIWPTKKIKCAVWGPCYVLEGHGPSHGALNSGSEKWPISQFLWTWNFCSVKFLTVKNEHFLSAKPSLNSICKMLQEASVKNEFLFCLRSLVWMTYAQALAQENTMFCKSTAQTLRA